MALRKILPRSIAQAIELWSEKRTLSKLPTSSVTAQNLVTNVPKFDTPELAEEWTHVESVMKDVGLENPRGGVNVGDRRAIYQLARTIGARSILEVGTHVGASTLMLALAAKRNGAALTTVDIVDVNSPSAAWSRTGCRQSPSETLRAATCEARFVTMPSVDYLRRCKEKYDLIFLDDLHTAENVYRQIPLVLGLLNPSGTILMHDVFPDRRPLWSNGAVVPGPWLAIERLKREGAPLRVHPLGSLSWPTKCNSNVTSLAVLTKAAME